MVIAGQAEMLKLKETIRLKLLADARERNVWSQPQNLLKDKQRFEAKCVALSDNVTQRHHLQEYPHGDDMLSARDADMETKPNRRDGFTSYQQSRMKLPSAKSCTGVTASLVLITSHMAQQEAMDFGHGRSQESRVGTIDSKVLVGRRMARPRCGVGASWSWPWEGGKREEREGERWMEVTADGKVRKDRR